MDLQRNLEQSLEENRVLKSTHENLTEQLQEVTIEKGEIASQLERVVTEKARAEVGPIVTIIRLWFRVLSNLL